MQMNLKQLSGAYTIPDFFGDKQKMLAYYRSFEDAKKEISSINAAIQQGQTNYDLQYFVNIKSKGLNYIIDDSTR